MTDSALSNMDIPRDLGHWIGFSGPSDAAAAPSDGAERAGKWLDVTEPATGTVFARVAAGTGADVERAVRAAQRAFPAWSALPAAERGAWMERLAQAVEDRMEAFVQAESMDTGKPVHVARAVDIPRAVLNLRYFAGLIRHRTETQARPRPGVTHTTVHAPLGVVGCISPWNLPLYLFTWKIAPALAAGNCVVGKPSEVTPLTAWMLGRAAADIGFPEGVLNIVQGTGPAAGAALVDHPDIKAISFTGSTAVGRDIAVRAASRLVKTSLELGGKNPTIVFADADQDKAAREAARAAFANQGQICLCGSRILVEASVYEAFRERLLSHVGALRVGDPLEPTSDLGALVSRAHFDKVSAWLDIARAEGARILTGGGPVTPTKNHTPSASSGADGRCANGWFIAPTLLEGLPPDCRTNQEEIFGPVATLQPFENEADALRQANGTHYGLAASVWTSSLARAHRVGNALESGLVWINCWMERELGMPFGGVKQSGLGREGGHHALDFFSEIKTITVNHE
jgi:aminomuconate-semialdehyde/2-hydroxymuconate-6-semialdehyde dehydrogenase